MKKIMMLALVLLFSSSLAFADSTAPANECGKEMGCKISCALKKLNPLPFFQEQAKKYQERKAAQAK